MDDSYSLPELCLYTYTNKKSVKTQISPHQGKQIILQQRRAKSSYISSRNLNVKFPRKGWCPQSAGGQSRPGSTTRPASNNRCYSRIQRPAYTLTRTSSAVEMKINANTFFNKDKHITQENSRLNERSTNETTTFSAQAIEKLTQESLEREERLQREIVELTIKLDYVKKKRLKESKQKEEQIELLKKRWQKGFEFEKRKQQKIYEEEIRRNNERHYDERESLKSRFTMDTAKLEEEIQYHKNVLEETKTDLQLEKAESLQALESDMKQRNQKEIEYIITKMNEEKEKVILQAKEKMTEVHEGKMETMKNNYTAIIERLENECLGVSKLLDDIDEANLKIKKEKKQNKHLLEQLQIKTKETIKIESNLFDTETKLADLQDNYQSKIRSFEERYFKQFDYLRLENTKVRSKLMEHVSIISNQHIELERLNSKGKSILKSRMKTVLQARASAKLSLIPEIITTNIIMPGIPINPRPLSAPGTREERHRVCVSAKQREQEELQNTADNARIKRPQTCKIKQKSLR